MNNTIEITVIVLWNGDNIKPKKNICVCYCINPLRGRHMETERNYITQSMCVDTSDCKIGNVLSYELKINVNTGKYSSAGIKGIALFFIMG